jgi:hypothetical protein
MVGDFSQVMAFIQKQTLGVVNSKIVGGLL